MPERPPPTSTYRLQLRDGLTLERVADEWLAPLAELGVSHVYLSPPFVAADGSTHGYDVVDPSRVDPALGGDEAFAELAAAARRHGLGLVVDLVPNHVAVDHDRNEAWWDLLRNGPSSAWAAMFDLDWAPPEQRLRGRLLLPVLPDHYGRELEARSFRLEIAHDEVRLWHPSVHCPVEASSLAPIIRAAAAAIDDEELGDLAGRLGALPDWSTPTHPGDWERRWTDEPKLRDELGRRMQEPTVADAVRRVLDDVTADVEAMDQLISAQPYRPARWQTALEDLGYRRFFDVNTLVGVRVDRRGIFDLTHAAVARWVADDLVDGLRIDHIDGLRWPGTYLDRLRELVGDRWVVVEKILEGDEDLPPWPVAGTTGYEVSELIDRLDLDEAGRPVLERLARVAGGAPDVEATVAESKLAVLDGLLAADLNRLTELLLRICERRRRVRDVTRRELHDALRQVLTRMPVYRTYVEPGRELSADDEAVLRSVLAEAAVGVDDVDPEIFELLGQLLLGDAERTDEEWDFVARLQQLSSPVTAKGGEDTAWFRLASLVARCEVGASPDRWAVELSTFHDAMARRAERWPAAMTTTTTHDTKRSADVRARLGLLSQRSADWEEVATRWMSGIGATAPDPTLAYQALQTMVGAWPIDEERTWTHLLKVAREAKLRTSWLRPDDEFERELRQWVAAVHADDDATARIDDWVRRTHDDWRRTVLAHTALALTLPGVPDLYQGAEEELLVLTDPDNRRPAEPSRLRASLQELRTREVVVATDDLAKLAVTHAALQLRRRRPESFGAEGAYTPLWAAGPRSQHAVAFTRGADVVVVATRRVAGVADGWRGTTIDLPGGRWDSLLDGTTWEGRVELGELLATWPVSVLERQG